MGCGLRLWDQHGYAPLSFDANLKDLCHQAGLELYPEELVEFTEDWDTGCTDMGDVSCVMPAIHPYIGGAEGASHSSEYRIADPVIACVESAKVQTLITVRLLENGAENARDILAKARKDYPTIPEYLAMIDANCIDQEAVIYEEDGTVTLKYQ